MKCKKCNCEDIQFIESQPLKMKTTRRIILFASIFMIFASLENKNCAYVSLVLIWVYIAFRIFDSIRCNRKRMKAVCRNCGNSWYIK